MAKCGGLCFFQLLLRAYAKQTRGAENVKSNFDVFLFSSYFSTFFIVPGYVYPGAGRLCLVLRCGDCS